MFIRSVRLRNIRSYEELDLSFEEGITMLAGDIGAGKSSILQAIEFALFGIQRGGLEGEGLLRHGTEEGFVELAFSINDAEYAIKRVLKRASAGVRQASGTFTQNNETTEFSAQELKARILQVLGYPEQLLTKSKGLIFRHTVYTPQEEMKHILFMPTEDRLNTLRMLFGIDTYRTIKENTQLLLKELRAQEKFLVQEAAALPTIQAACLAVQEQAAQTLMLVQQAEERATHATDAVHKARQTLNQARQTADYALSLEHQRLTLTSRVRELERTVKNAQDDIAHIDEYLAVAVESVTDNTQLIERLRAEQQSHEDELIKVTSELAGLRGERKLHLKHEHDITSLNECPLCTQPVSASHKERVHSDTQHLLERIDASTTELAQKEVSLQQKRAHLREKLQTLAEHQKRFAAYQRELFVRKDKERQKHVLTDRLREANIEVTAARASLMALPAVDAAAKEAYTQAQQTLAAVEHTMHEKLSVLNEAKEQYARVQTQVALGMERLERAKQAKKQAGTMQEQRQWLEDGFLEVVSLIERHVLASIHAEFRELLSSWFSKLVEDEAISISLGEQFEPLVSQNGYDASLEQLSGGEKTAVALSYRLGLYKVVSDFISTVNTKDLLLLDEPTDGFSSEQLDRVREVLRSLGCRQIILVSHETRMEGSCDHIIRIDKRMHRSEAYS